MKPLFLSLLTGLLLALACTKSPVEPERQPPRTLGDVEKQLVEIDNQFGLKLFQKIVATTPQKNVFISPFSISLALGMTLNGAAGATQTAMQQTLEMYGLSDEEINQNYQHLTELLLGLDPKVKLEIANSIWMHSDFTAATAFIQTNQTYFNARVASLDFRQPQAVTTINAWVNQATHGKIDKILESISPEEIMFLINAIYFKGVWTYQFDPQQTQSDNFYPPRQSPKTCDFMMQENKFDYAITDQFQMIDLPYGDGLFRMLVLLPRTGVDLDSLMAAATPAQWNTWLSNLHESKGAIHLPRFKLTYEITLNEVLTALGMGIAFTDQADFTRIHRAGQLFITEVKHKTFVEVNEEGTEAAAVTSVGIGVTSIGSGFEMRVNRPFIFAIHDQHSQTILFIGKIIDPS
ncbi:serpin family protein [candidate division KSB1 bacterium]|nr:serpin family protein [candidate division KSB1 bacterium]